MIIYDISDNKFQLVNSTQKSIELQCLEVNDSVSILFFEECKVNYRYWVKKKTLALYYALEFIKTNEQAVIDLL